MAEPSPRRHKSRTIDQVHVSQWWIYRSRNGALEVLIHQDDPRLQPVRQRLSEAFAGIIVDAYLRELRQRHEASQEGTRNPDAR